MAVCPPKHTKEWQDLEQKLGIDNAYKMWLENGSNDEAVDEMLRILDPVRNTLTNKTDKLYDAGREVNPKKGTDPATGERLHEYWSKTTGKELKSVSRVLDLTDDTAYQGDPVGSVYADNGTAIHFVFEEYITRPRGASDANILIAMRDKGVPDSVLGDVKNIVRKLEEEGTLVAEVTLGDTANGIAGTTDIVWLKYDGTVDIIDIKTAHETPKSRGALWDPLHHFGGYKTRRYSAQTEFYGEFVGRALGQPISNKWVLPIEITYNEKSPAKGFNTVKILELENVKDYGYSRRAKEIVDGYFGVDRKMNLEGLVSVDDTTDFMERITGAPEGRTMNKDKEAARILAIANKYGGKYYRGGDKKYLFRSDDPIKRHNQIITQYLDRVDKAQRNLTESIINYVNTGEDAFLDDPGEHATVIASNVKDWLKAYKEKPKIYNLNEIKGFENIKQGWVVFQSGTVMDLLYLGAEELDQKIHMNTTSMLFNNRENLFGDYMTTSEAKQLMGSGLKNTRKDAKKLEGALIMMAIKASMPEVTFERAFVYSSYDNRTKSPSEIQLKDILPVVEKIKDRKEFQDIIPNRMREIFADKEAFNIDNYGQNYVKSYLDYIHVNELGKERKYLNALLPDYVAGKDDSKIIEDRILETIAVLTNKNDDSYKRELFLLSSMLYEIKKVNTATDPIAIAAKVISLPTNLKNAVMSDLIFETNSALNKFKQKYWNKYKKPSEKYYKALFRTSGIESIAGNYLLADTTRMYNPLFETKEFIVTSSGKKKTLSTFNMIAEDSAKFETLTKSQQEFITMFNNYVQEGAIKAGLVDNQGNVQWKRGRMPLIKKSAMRQIGEAFKGNLSKDRFNDVVENSFKDNFIFTADNIQAEPGGVINLFANQQNNQMNDPIDEMLGFSEDGHVNMSEYDKYETNMEIILDMFMINANKVEALNKSGRLFDAAKALLDYQKSNFFNESLDNNIDWVETWRAGMLNNKDKVDTPFARKAMIIIKPTNAIASLGIIGLSATTAIPATIGQHLTLISKSIGNSFADKGLFNLKDWAKAGVTLSNPFNYKLIDAIMTEYSLFDLDISALTSSQRRFTDKGIFNTKNAYFMLRMGDWTSRAQAIVAQLHHDGNWKAHSLVNGKLVYDVSKDNRFNGKGRYSIEEGKALKKMLTDELEKEGYVSELGVMLRAYDERLRAKYKDIADTTFGATDKEAKGFWNYVWQGKLLGIFKSWLPARIDTMMQKPGEKLFAGDYRMMKGPGGEITPVWKGEMVEGYIYTLGAMGFNLKQLITRSETKPLTASQKSNVARMMVDMSMIGLGYLATSSIAGALDDSKLDDETANLLTKSLQDVAATYTLISEASGLFALPVSLNYAMRLWRTLAKVTTGVENADELLVATPWNTEYRILKEFTD